MDISYYKRFEPIDGKWYFLRELGAGSYGSVYEVERRDFSNNKAAMKIVSIPSSEKELMSYRSDNPGVTGKQISDYFYGFVREFINEFQIMEKVKGNSYIVSYEDHEVKPKVGTIGWDIFIRMELLTPLNAYMATRSVTRELVIKLGIDICRALEICQQNNIIHRDIKPGNIFVSKTGDFKLGDFGVARIVDGRNEFMSRKGTYIYMAPEVYYNKRYGMNVDMYSLGIVLYKFLNNNFEPFRTARTSDDAQYALDRRVRGETFPMPKFGDPEIMRVIMKACHYNPNMRYQTAREMRKDLEALLDDTTTVGRYHTPPPRPAYTPPTPPLPRDPSPKPKSSTGSPWFKKAGDL